MQLRSVSDAFGAQACEFSSVDELRDVIQTCFGFTPEFSIDYDGRVWLRWYEAESDGYSESTIYEGMADWDTTRWRGSRLLVAVPSSDQA